MTAELGQLALIFALLMAAVQAAFPLAGTALRLPAWVAVAKPAARAQALFLAVSFYCLEQSFVVNDFSVRYVAEHSNSALPLFYRIAAAWGAHEGSVLLLALILGLWTFAVSIFNRGLSDLFVARVLGVLGLISVGILAFILFTSNPFERLTPAPLDGNDLNPLLQDFGLAVHPPMLYMGYVGLAVPFAFAIAALLSGSLDIAWARWSRPWTLVAWAFLTLGITLGSWWAYYELGWGGWWFWDPVENASFMPWLMATALIHSLAVTEKRGAFKAWTVLLAIFAFSLSLLGMFLVRSGVLVSVHAFANDPERGLFILVFLGLVIGSSLLLYALRAPAVKDHARFHWFSREALLLVNNVLLVVAAASVLLGTLYPLVLDALGLGKISVGPPYFSSVFTPVTAPLFLLAGIGPLVAWRRGDPGKLWRQVRWLIPVSLIAAVVISALWFNPKDIVTLAFLATAFWLGATSLLPLWQRLRRREGLRGLRQPAGFYGMTLAHFGLAVFLIGVGISNHYSIERTVRLAPGETAELGGYRFTFKGVREFDGPNYGADEGLFEVSRNGEPVARLTPQKRFYRVQRNVMTEAAIDPGLRRDLYVALGERLEGDAWSVRLYVKPAVRWIWLGGLLMMAGGLVAAADRRYRSVKVTAQATATVNATV
ncbi:cytochrome c-type biogenesis protein CcmF [Methylomarinovum caldicuralii]|uniref:Cytochrome c-type biogenesis protein CcmF n=1 Tax=Methylomarinovum caldicuralii TaxID=438856 RepID=A0AAU9CGW3_9GAMM|nr:heme lyase CcmF/NrfE family subunit [Methylomarinovum caldicuralii]BCX82220.1 cytochrome c-type biogenesis protein CcmF [Methylomarinovum caldicuralii]